MRDIHYVFYKRRIIRIYPTYVLFAATISILTALAGGVLSAFDWFCNLTTLSYYRIGGCFIDWYLSSIFVLYILYPLLYEAVRRLKWGFPAACSLIVCAIIAFCNIHWWYNALIARIPIFILGIFFALNRNKQQFFGMVLVYVIVFFISIGLHQLGHDTRGFFLTDMVAPILIVGIAAITTKCSNITNSKVGRTLTVLGTNSLEIYVANMIALKCLHFSFFKSLGGMSVLVSYLLLNCLIALFFIQYGRFVTLAISSQRDHSFRKRKF